jgi:hypothetical protein
MVSAAWGDYRRQKPMPGGGDSSTRPRCGISAGGSFTVPVSFLRSEFSGRIFTCDGSALAYCLSIHFIQKDLISVGFGIPHMSRRRFLNPRRLLNYTYARNSLSQPGRPSREPENAAEGRKAPQQSFVREERPQSGKSDAAHVAGRRCLDDLSGLSGPILWSRASLSTRRKPAKIAVWTISGSDRAPIFLAMLAR